MVVFFKKNAFPEKHYSFIINSILELRKQRLRKVCDRAEHNLLTCKFSHVPDPEAVQPFSSVVGLVGVLLINFQNHTVLPNFSLASDTPQSSSHDESFLLSLIPFLMFRWVNVMAIKGKQSISGVRQSSVSQSASLSKAPCVLNCNLGT